MIVLFAGNDALQKHVASEKFLTSLPRDTEVFNLGRGDWNSAQIESLYSGSGLFWKSSAVVFSNILDATEAREFLFPRLDKLQESQNYFVFLEGKLAKAVLDIFKKARAEVEVFEKQESKEERFNSFLLANALGQKSKLDLWILYRQAIMAGVSLEELAGVL